MKFTTQVIQEKTAKRNWWIGLFTDKHSAAKAKERALAGTLKEETVQNMMLHFKMRCVRQPQEALWEEITSRTFNVSSKSKWYGQVEAFTEQDAIELIAKAEMGTTERAVNIEGVEQFKWEALACLLTAEEIS